MPQIGGADGTGDWGACDPAEPRNRRTRSSIVIEGPGGGRLLVDTSPDLREQLLACAIPRIDAILFTHAHADHILGLDEVRILNRIADRPLDAYADAATATELRRRFDYAFKPWQPPHFFRPVLTLHEVAAPAVIEVAGMQVQVFDQDHGALTTLGLRIGGFAYCTDVVRLDEVALGLLEGVDTLMIDCFQRAGHHTHGSLPQVKAWRDRLRPRRMLLTHLGYDMDWAWLAARLPDDVTCAYDGQTIMLDD